MKVLLSLKFTEVICPCSHYFVGKTIPQKIECTCLGFVMLFAFRNACRIAGLDQPVMLFLFIWSSGELPFFPLLFLCYTFVVCAEKPIMEYDSV